MPWRGVTLCSAPAKEPNFAPIVIILGLMSPPSKESQESPKTCSPSALGHPDQPRVLRGGPAQVSTLFPWRRCALPGASPHMHRKTSLRTPRRRTRKQGRLRHTPCSWESHYREWISPLGSHAPLHICRPPPRPHTDAALWGWEGRHRGGERRG